MHKYDNHTPRSEQGWFDAPEIFAEFLARTGLIDPVLTTIAKMIVATPVAIVGWLGSELLTPTNSAPPIISPSDIGAFSGLVFVHRNEAKAWVFVHVGDSRDTGKRYAPARGDPHLGASQPDWQSEDRTELRSSDQRAAVHGELWGDSRWGGV